MRAVSAAAPCAALLALALSCSHAAPEINAGSLELVWHENGGAPVERLSLFVLPADGDGIEDLDELWLFHEWEGLSWQVSSEDWVRETINGQLWVGSRNIAMPDGEPVPRGQYLAMLVDKSGDRTERALTFDAPARETFPEFSITAGRYRAVSDFPEQNFVVYDKDGAYLMTIPVPENEGEVRALALPSQASSMALWARDAEKSFSAFTDVAPLYE